VAGVAVAVLVMTAGSAGAASRGSTTALAPQKPQTVPYIATGNCAPVSRSGATIMEVCASTNSISGNGAAVATITLNGNGGTDTSVEYDAQGARRVKETFTFAAGANGTTTPGTGTCTGGTGAYKHATCSYTLTGTINTQTDQSTSMEVGTITGLNHATTAVAPQQPHTISYRAMGATCAQVTQNGPTRTLVCAGGTVSPRDPAIWGSGGATVAAITLNGTSGTSLSITYGTTGVRRTKETFAAVVGASGTATLTGSGTCIPGGTGVWKNAKCSYSLTGTTNTRTNVGTSSEVGTINR